MSDNKNLNGSRVEPRSLEAEKAVLGCMLIDKESVAKALEDLDHTFFYDKKNEIIFLTIKELFDSSKVIDSLSLTEALKKEKNLTKVGGAYYITGLSNDAPSTGNVEYYAKLVKDKAVLRSLISTAKEMSEDAYSNEMDSIELLDKAEQKIFNISQKTEANKFLNVKDLLGNVLDHWSERKSGQLTGIPCGFRDVDSRLSGFQNSDFIVLAGRPSMGKTALALSFARNAAVKYGHKVGIFSLEMSHQQLTERLITSEAEVDSHLVRTGRIPKNDWGKLSKAAGTLANGEIYIDDSAYLSITDLRAKSRKLKSEKDVDIIFVDYMQLLHQGGRVENRLQEISFISRSLKAMAKELNVPVIGLSQLSRAVESRADHRPIMSDLRESGAIEQDADVVMFIYRKFVYSNDEEDKGLAEVIIAKHRNGPTGISNIAFTDSYAKFENLDYSRQEEPLPT